MLPWQNFLRRRANCVETLALVMHAAGAASNASQAQKMPHAVRTVSTSMSPVPHTDLYANGAHNLRQLDLKCHGLPMLINVNRNRWRAMWLRM